jgi:hypothetical protein
MNASTRMHLIAGVLTFAFLVAVVGMVSSDSIKWESAATTAAPVQVL